MRPPASQLKFGTAYRAALTVLATYAVVGGALAVIGWVAGIPRLIDWEGNGITMKVNPAVLCILAGAAILLLFWRSKIKWVPQALALIVAIVGGLTLFEHLTGINIGIDTLLYNELPGAVATVAPGRMGPPASTSFLLLGTGLLLSTGSRRARRIASALGVVVAGLVGVSLTGYVLGASSLFALAKVTAIALQTATVILALALGLILLVPEYGVVATLRRKDAGGILARRMIVPLVVLPLVMGWLTVRGFQLGYYDAAFGIATFAFLIALCLGGIMFNTARRLGYAAVDLQESRKELVRQLGFNRGILESISDGFHSVDKDMRFTHFNEAARKLLASHGVEADTVLGKSIFEVFPKDQLGPAADAFLRTMKERQPTEVEIFYAAWGQWFTERNYPTDDGGMASFFIDITERKKHEEALRQADRRKDEFLATLAHELRNPLAPVRHGLEIMKRADNQPDLVEEARSTMERQISHMVRLIDDLLDVSRITQDKLLLRKERVDLSTIIRQSIETCESALKSTHHQLAVNLPPDPIHLDADPVRLVQVFGNLLNNACKYTDGHGKITITAERTGSDARITVNDTGIGIPPDMLDKVFDMFTQINRDMKRTQGGLGIGLSLAKRLVEMHGGAVKAHSDGAARGSTFTVTLPALAPAIQPPDIPAQRANGSSVARRILVVDDNVDAAKSLAKLLRLEGHETQVAHDGLEGVNTAITYQPDIILLDIGMPNMNGYEACRAIRSRDGGARFCIIALTGWGQDEDRRKSKEAGFDEHLVKPVDFPTLIERIAAAPDKPVATGGVS
jgi:PAS domain S-box-containing protein